MRAATSTAHRRSLTEKARLASEILGSYRQARRLMQRQDLRTVLRVLRGGSTDHQAIPPDAIREGTRLGRVVGRVLGPLPFQSRCLIRSLVLTDLLSNRGIPSKLVIGVKPGEAFAAHAWVELDGIPALPPGGDDFARLVEL